LIFIYSKDISPRLKYVSYELFARRLGVEYQLISDPASFIVGEGARINYSDNQALPGLQIHPHGLLSDTTVQPLMPETHSHQEWSTILFPADNDIIPFDVFAASFYILSRYEEYQPHQSDLHGRFKVEDSIAFQSGFLNFPLVDHWALHLKWILSNRYHTLEFQLPAFRFYSTVDIDYVYQYHGIGFIWYWLKLAFSLMRFRFQDVFIQLKVGITHQHDPYDTYTWIEELCKESQVDMHYFVLMRSGKRYDRNAGIRGDIFKRTIHLLSTRCTLGIHPSYHTINNPDLIQQEIKQLEKITGHTIHTSRQHYLRYALPHTMQYLSDSGITHDYSVGYANHAGFRASTAHPFAFFNLSTNCETHLLLHPVTSMDVTFKNNPEMNPGKAYSEVEQLMNEVKKVNGIYIHIWHNSNLSDSGGWRVWRELIRKIHTLAASKQQQEID
jgi:hypothetical protein